MSWGTVAGVALLTGVVAAAGAGYLGYLCEDWYSIHSHELGSGLFAISIGVVGLVCGFIVGAIVALKVHESFWKTQGIAIVVVLAACISAGFFAWFRGPSAPTIFRETAPTLRGEQLMLVAEVRFPAGWTPDDPANPTHGSDCTLQPSGPAFVLGNHVFGGKMLPEIYGSVESVRKIDGQWVASCAVKLSSSRENRYVRFKLGKGTDIQFRLGLPPVPDTTHEQWTEWRSDEFSQPVDHPLIGYAYRCRVRRIHS